MVLIIPELLHGRLREGQIVCQLITTRERCRIRIDRPEIILCSDNAVPDGDGKFFCRARVGNGDRRRAALNSRHVAGGGNFYDGFVGRGIAHAFGYGGAVLFDGDGKLLRAARFHFKRRGGIRFKGDVALCIIHFEHEGIVRRNGAAENVVLVVLVKGIPRDRSRSNRDRFPYLCLERLRAGRVDRPVEIILDLVLCHFGADDLAIRNDRAAHVILYHLRNSFVCTDDGALINDATVLRLVGDAAE